MGWRDIVTPTFNFQHISTVKFSKSKYVRNFLIIMQLHCCVKTLPLVAVEFSQGRGKGFLFYFYSFILFIFAFLCILNLILISVGFELFSSSRLSLRVKTSCPSFPDFSLILWSLQHNLISFQMLNQGTHCVFDFSVLSSIANWRKLKTHKISS